MSELSDQIRAMLKPLIDASKGKREEGHCEGCLCNGSDERIRLKKLFGRVPDTGCIDYRAGRYCGLPVAHRQTDYCESHKGRG